MAADFPTSLPDAVTFDDDDTPGGVDLPEFLNQNRDELRALGTKLGTGSSTPASDTSLEGTGSGTSGWNKRAKAQVYHNADQSVANSTETALAFNSERFDNDTIHDTSSNNSRLTCKTAGLYLIVANVRWDANTTGGRVLNIRLNGGTKIAESAAAPTPSSVMSHNLTTIYQLAVNDYVEVVATQFSGGPLDVKYVADASPNFMMVRLSA